MHVHFSTGPGSAATLEVMGSYQQALAGGLSVWLAGEDLGLAGEAAEVTFGPVGNLTALRCVPQVLSTVWIVSFTSELGL